MNYDLRIKNGQVITEDGLQRVDLSIKDGKIAQIGKTLKSDTASRPSYCILSNYSYC